MHCMGMCGHNTAVVYLSQTGNASAEHHDLCTHTDAHMTIGYMYVQSINTKAVCSLESSYNGDYNVQFQPLQISIS